MAIVRISADADVLAGKRLAAGDLDELVEIERDVEQAARRRGINKMSIIGRRGWRRKLDGFREVGVVLTKEI